jgi:hypothetical protein
MTNIEYFISGDFLFENHDEHNWELGNLSGQFCSDIDLSCLDKTFGHFLHDVLLRHIVCCGFCLRVI